jgi:hypothetical protein
MSVKTTEQLRNEISAVKNFLRLAERTLKLLRQSLKPAAPCTHCVVVNDAGRHIVPGQQGRRML